VQNFSILDVQILSILYVQNFSILDVQILSILYVQNFSILDVQILSILYVQILSVRYAQILSVVYVQILSVGYMQNLSILYVQILSILYLKFSVYFMWSSIVVHQLAILPWTHTVFQKRNRRQVVVYPSYHFGRNSKARQPSKRDFALRVVIFIVKITVCSRDKRQGLS
jgi:hypothetical protein